MKPIHLILLVALFPLLKGAPAFAETSEGLIIAAQGGAFPDPPYERGDPAMIILTALDGDCGKSRDRGTYRSRVLLRETEALMNAVKKHDDATIQATAAKLAKSINSSRMFRSCWNTILKDQKVNMTIYNGSF